MATFTQSWANAPSGDGAASYGAGWACDDATVWGVRGGIVENFQGGGTTGALPNGALYRGAAGEAFKNGQATIWYPVGRTDNGVAVRFKGATGSVSGIFAHTAFGNLYIYGYENGSKVFDNGGAAIGASLASGHAWALSVTVTSPTAASVLVTASIYDAAALTNTVSPPAAIFTTSSTITPASGASSPLLTAGAVGMHSLSGVGVAQIEAKPGDGGALSLTAPANAYQGVTAAWATATASGGTGPYTYTWYSGATAAAASSLNNPIAASNAATLVQTGLAPGSQRYLVCKVTDGAGNSVVSPPVLSGTLPAGTLSIYYVGNSITAGSNTSAGNSASDNCSAKLAASGFPNIYVNAGKPSTTTLDWVPGGNQNQFIIAAVQDMNSRGTDTVFLDLGINDIGNIAASVADYSARLTAIIRYILANAPLVQRILVNTLCYAPHVWQPGQQAGDPNLGQRTYPDATVQAFNQSIANVVSSIASPRVFLGDTGAFAAFQANFAQYGAGNTGSWFSEPDRLHPNDLGAPQLGGKFWGGRFVGLFGVPPVAVQSVFITSPVPPVLPGGSTLQLAALVLPAGASQAVTWAATVYNPDGTTAPGSITALGLLTLPALANTGRRVVVATTASDGKTTATASIYVSPATVDSITVFAPFAADGGTQVQLAATVNGANAGGTGVTWGAALAGADGTAGAVQTISAGGLLTLPATAAANQTVTVTATSVMDTTKSGTATILVPAAGDSLKAGDLNAQYVISKSLRGAGR